jgi:hypothetical protein
MKSRVLVLLVVGISAWLIATIGWLSMREYAVNTYIFPTITTFYSSDEAFIFIGTSTSLLAERRAATRLRSAFGSAPLPEKIGEELFVFHFKGEKVTKSRIESAGHSGSPFAFRGQIYWARGRLGHEAGPHQWRWTGSNFVAMSEHNWSEIKREAGSELKLFSDMNSREGWTEKYLGVRGRETELNLTLQRYKLKLSVEATELRESRSRVIIKLESTELSVVLMDVIEGFKTITPEEYLVLKNGERQRE